MLKRAVHSLGILAAERVRFAEAHPSAAAELAVFDKALEQLTESARTVERLLDQERAK